MSVILLKNYPFLFAFCLLLYSCKAEGPAVAITPAEELKIPEKEMVKILTDVHIAEGLIQMSASPLKDSIGNATYQRVYKHYNIDEEKFDESLKQYLNDPVLADRVYKKVLENLSKLETKPNPTLKDTKQQIKSINSNNK